MSPRLQRSFALCGPLFAILFFPGMLLSGLLPPPSPSDGAAQVASFWSDDPTAQRFGLMLCMIAAGFTGPFVAIISVYLKKVRGGEAYSNLQLIGGATGFVAVVVPIMIFAAASFRPDERPEAITQAINDMAWLPFIMNYPPALLQCLAIGLAAFTDKSSDPIFPRWVGYYNLWTAFLFLPGGFAVFFKDGPLAWSGVLAFWVPAVLFGVWFLVMCVVLYRAIDRHGGAP